MPYTEFIRQAVNLRDRVAADATKFGIPTFSRNLIVRKFTGEGYLYTAIAPRPRIKPATPAQGGTIGTLAGLTVTEADYEVSGISRAYTRESLIGADIDYLIDATLRHGTATGGILCELVREEEKAIAWTLTLRRKISEQSMY